MRSTADGLRLLGSMDGRGGETPYRHVFSEVGTALAGKSGRAGVVLISDGLPDYEDEALAAAQAFVSGYDVKSWRVLPFTSTWKTSRCHRSTFRTSKPSTKEKGNGAATSAAEMAMSC